MHTCRTTFRRGLLLSALLLAACSSGTSATGSSSATTSGTTSSTTASTWGDSKGTLTVPAASFSSDLTITYNSGGVDVSDIGSATVISTPVTVTFSSATPVTGTSPVSLTLKINTGEYARAIADNKAVYAKIKIRGESLGSDDVGPNEMNWLPVIGSINTSDETMTLKIFASAGTIYATVVSGTELAAFTTSFPSSDIAAPEKSITNSILKDAEDPEGIPIATDSGRWLVICDLGQLSDAGLTTCKLDDPTSMASLLLNDLDSYATQLSALGFSQMVVAQLTLQELQNANVVSSISDALLRRSPLTLYNIAYLTNPGRYCRGTGTIYGCFQLSTGYLFFNEDFNDADTESKFGKIVPHEMTHAVQGALCYSCFKVERDGVDYLSRDSAFKEGSAEAVGQYFYTGGNASLTMDRLFSNTARDWSVPLGTYGVSSATTYRTSEFYELADFGNIAYLPAAFVGYHSADGSIFNMRLKAAIDAALSIDYQQAFIQAVGLRNYTSVNQPNYHTGLQDWVEHSGTLNPFAADFYYFQAPFNNDPTADCYNIVSFTSDANPNLALIVVAADVAVGADGSIDLGNGLYASYITTGTELHTSKCAMDIIVANIKTDSGISDEASYTFLPGFD